MTPRQRYQQDLDHGLIQADAGQELALDALQLLYEQLMAAESRSPANWLRRWLPAAGADRVEGLYFWGGVGRGKTYLMDIFFEALPDGRKLRSHFHRFMQRIHQELAGRKGQKNPLDLVSADLARGCRVICLDEFYVADIGDAMLLANLLDGLLARGVVLVMTSNIQPDLLYENGLQRDRFLPAIAAIKTHCRILELAGGVDYRLRSLTSARLYHWPLGEEADAQLGASFRQLAPDLREACRGESIDVLGRPIASRQTADDVIWFDFAVLCGGPRSVNDYIEIARIYHAVLLSNVPLLDDSRNDQVRRFVNLVDEFYDRNVKLVLSAAAPLDELYQGGSLAREFRRTRSRLQEMQSHEYLGRPHRP
ncbi:MAG: hypothetical protein RLZZ385_1799 [Pseudomonadota bacterium]|jgi:cell division protein ZapE